MPDEPFATAAPRYSWTQPICAPCWAVRQPGRTPYKLREPERERCSFCGSDTQSGIYTREDPKAVPYPAVKDADPTTTAATEVGASDGTSKPEPQSLGASSFGTAAHVAAEKYVKDLNAGVFQ